MGRQGDCQNVVRELQGTRGEISCLVIGAGAQHRRACCSSSPAPQARLDRTHTFEVFRRIAVSQNDIKDWHPTPCIDSDR